MQGIADSGGRNAYVLIRPMRILLLTALLTGCPSDPAAPPDAGVQSTDSGLTGSGSEYWPCYFWPAAQTKCAPRCANHTLLGREVFGTGNTCELVPGVNCPTENMTAAAGDGGACCWVTNDHVDLIPCT